MRVGDGARDREAAVSELPQKRGVWPLKGVETDAEHGEVGLVRNLGDARRLKTPHLLVERFEFRHPDQHIVNEVSADPGRVVAVFPKGVQSGPEVAGERSVEAVQRERKLLGGGEKRRVIVRSVAEIVG